MGEHLTPRVSIQVEEDGVAVEKVLFWTHERQEEFLASILQYGFTLYGGARGGGKSKALRWILFWILLWHAQQGRRGVIVGLFSATYEELWARQVEPWQREIREAERLCGQAPGFFGRYNGRTREFRLSEMFGSGIIRFCNMANMTAYQSAEFAAIGVDEITLVADREVFEYLRGSLRWPGVSWTPFFAATNPTGPGHCLTHGEVLTPDGWRDIREFKRGDAVFTVTRSGEMVESYVDQVHRSHYRGYIKRVRGRGLSMSCTPNHMIPKVGGTKSDPGRPFTLMPFESLGGDGFVLRTVQWQGERLESFSPPEFRTRRTRLVQPSSITGDQFAELFGWFISEGFTIQREKFFGIAQEKGPQRARIGQLLAECGFKATWGKSAVTVHAASWWNYFRQFGKSRDKWIPSELKAATPDQLKLLLDALMDGDGHWERRGRSGAYYTISRQLADDVAEIALKLGYKVYVSSRERPNREGTSYAVNLHRSKQPGSILRTGQHRYCVKTKAKVRNVVDEPFDGEVYCLGIPETHTFVVRQDGCVWVSGNSWVKRLFIAKDFSLEIDRNLSPEDFNYVQCLPRDNPFLPEEYIRDQLGTMPEHFRQPWLEGSWDIVAGQRFDRFREYVHILEPFDLRELGQLKLYRSVDFGTLDPMAAGWYVTYRVDQEWPGDIGLRCIKIHEMVRAGMNAREQAWAILEEEKRLRMEEWFPRDLQVETTFLDPQAWEADDDGLSLAQKFFNEGIEVEQAIKDRRPGWDAVGDLLYWEHAPQDIYTITRKPCLRFFNQCQNTTQQIQDAMWDPKKGYDILTPRTAGHHWDALDETRYLCLTHLRPPSTSEPMTWQEKQMAIWNAMERSGKKSKRGVGRVGHGFRNRRGSLRGALDPYR